MADRNDLPYADAAVTSYRPARTEPINAILYAQFHLKGGYRNTLGAMALVAVCAVIGIGLMFASVRPGQSVTRPAEELTYIFLGIQWLVLGLYGTSRVTAAIRQDVAGGIIESHRLTPNSPLAAALGYLAGAPIQAMAVSLVLFFAGMVTSFLGNVPLFYWFVANAVTLISCATVWTVVGVVSFSFTNAAAMPIIAVITLASSSLFMIVPALSVLSAPLITRSLFDVRRGGTYDIPPAYAFAIVGQALLSGVMILGIARRYRNADTPAFSLNLGLLLLGLWTAITVIGQSQQELFLRSWQVNEPEVQSIAAIISLMLIGLLPISAIARRFANTRDAEIKRRELPATASLAVSILIACLPLYLAEYTSRHTEMVRIIGVTGVMAAMFVGVTFLLAWDYMAGRRGFAWLFLFIALPNALPPIVATMLAMNEVQPSPTYSPLVGFSPIGSLIMLFDHRPSDALVGIAGQAALALVPLLLFLSRRRNQAQHTGGFAVELTTPPPLPK
ncbi:MAG: hypothetical protein QM754_06945 [Tepidisphaeraceae bacterium]